MSPSNQPEQVWADFTTPPLNATNINSVSSPPSSPEQKAVHRLTTSNTGTFYFAYGSNLSPSQMSLRLPHSPTSSIPIAIARLDTYRWLICQRGYANVVKLPASTAASHASTVWGVLYNLTADDEAVLDRYEGHNEDRNPHPQLNPDPKTQIERPYQQGNWDYNKLYLPVTVTRWLVDPSAFGVAVSGGRAVEGEDDEEEEAEDASNGSAVNGVLASSHGDRELPNPEPTTVRVLVYVDEMRTEPGRINFEYIGRMNRAIAESSALGYPHEWVEEVMRKFVVPDVHVREDGYVGTDQGYVEAEATEAYDEITENAVRTWRESQQQHQHQHQQQRLMRLGIGSLKTHH